MLFESKIKKINLEEMNIYDLLFFNEIIKNVFNDRKEEEQMKMKDNKYFIYYKIENLSKYRELLKEKSDLISKCSLIIYFNCNTFKELLLKVILDNDKNDGTNNRIVNSVYNYLLDLKEKMRYNQHIDNYFYEIFQLGHGKFSNYYDCNKIELDFGVKQSVYPKPIIVKTKIKYKKIINTEIKNMNFAVETLEIDREITLNLIQLFLRTPFERVTNGIYYNDSNEDCISQLNKGKNGSFIDYNRNSLVEYQDEFVPKDTKILFNIFEQLKYDEKNVFIQTCEAYLEGLKSDNGKELVFFIIALETLSNYEAANKKIAKTDLIYNLIIKLYDKEIVSKDYINYIYNLRSLYSHQGISNNGIKQIIFNVFENNKHLLSEVEMLTYSVMTKWLLSKGEINGG